ncbi:MAG: type II secretion system protein [Pirellulales bacterium]|nr:type II secretion system protein [Pirellulales bacterium]
MPTPLPRALPWAGRTAGPSARFRRGTVARVVTRHKRTPRVATPGHDPAYDLVVERKTASRGFSLLEVILALAILAGVIAVLGEIARMGLRSAARARDTTMAQLLAESKMAEVLSSTEGLAVESGVPFGTGGAGETDWIYSVELEPTLEQGIVAVRVTVAQDLLPERRPVSLSIVRWTVDPNYEFPEVIQEEEEEETQSESSETGADSLSPGGGSGP